jgi:integrase
MRDIASGKTFRDEKTKASGRSIVSGGKGAATRTVGLLGGIFSFAIGRGLLASNPVVGVKRFPDGKSESFLSDVQLADLGQALTEMSVQANPKAICIIKLLALTGARKSEVVRLKWNEVDFQHRCLRLAQSKTGHKTIPLGPAPLELLNSILTYRGSSDWVFPSKDEKGPFMGLEKVWKRVRARAGYPNLRIHDLRHSYASMGLARGNALAVIGALLGHSDVKTTSRYAHLADDPIRAAADQISRAMADAMADRSSNESDVVQLRPIRRASR